MNETNRKNLRETEWPAALLLVECKITEEKERLYSGAKTRMETKERTSRRWLVQEEHASCHLYLFAEPGKTLDYLKMERTYDEFIRKTRGPMIVANDITGYVNRLSFP